MKKTIERFSLIEKIIFSVVSIICIASALSLLYLYVDSFRIDEPGRGGEIREGLVGYPRFINPILAYTDAGKNLAYLLYSGLMRVDSNGNIVPDLAESYSISNDGKIYTFKLRSNAVFHDGQPITADDVAFTVAKVKDPGLKSPYAANWQGVDVKVVDKDTIQFILQTPYAPFIKNATIGILPQHIWKDADINTFTFSDYNFKPIGSGPYKIKEVKRSADGSPEYFKLVAFDKYATGEKNITVISLYLYPTVDALTAALKKGTITSTENIPHENVSSYSNKYSVATSSLLQTLGVFFNQTQAPVLANNEVRQALQMTVDRNFIIGKVLSGYGIEETSPLPHSLIDQEPGISASTASSSTGTSSSNQSTGSPAGDAIALLKKNGWTMNDQGYMEKKTKTKTTPLSFSITTSDNPGLLQTAEILKEEWKGIGANVSIISLSSDELNQNAIRQRKYDALLFGEIVGRGNDLYPFWSTIERKSPGLNIAQYANSKVDKLLQEARSSTSSDTQLTDVIKANQLISDDIPAIFIYSPDFVYLLPKTVKNFHLPSLEMPYERWTGIFDAYIQSKRIFNIRK